MFKYPPKGDLRRIDAINKAIDNDGSGSLDWTASEDAPWLTLDVVSGTVTATGDAAALTLTADPTGLAADQTHVARLTITTPATANSPAQTVEIPVVLSVGDVRNVPAVAGTDAGVLYLPLVEQ